MTALPENMKKICRAEVRRHVTPAAALAAALPRLRAEPNYAECADLFFEIAAREEVWDQRHDVTKAVKAATGRYDTQPQVAATCPELDEIVEDAYEMCIGGSKLGHLYGRELPRVRRAEKAAADGHMANVYLVDWLMTQLPADVQVMSRISQKRLWKAIRQARNRARAESGAPETAG